MTPNETTPSNPYLAPYFAALAEQGLFIVSPRQSWLAMQAVQGDTVTVGQADVKPDAITHE